MATVQQGNDSLVAAFGRIFGLTFKREIQMRKKKKNIITNTKVFTFRLTKKQMAELERMARKMKKTKGFVLRSILDSNE
jgi:hypothetical protein